MSLLLATDGCGSSISKYRNLDSTTDVLSFALNDPAEEESLCRSADGILRLGDIVVSYPQAVEAASENKLVDDQIVL